MAEETPPLYTPPAFAADRSIGWRIAQEQPFGQLLLPGGSITPLPFLADESAQVLRGHMARANPAARLPDATEATVTFLGPHAYVSPTWYAEPRQQVPTWNYVFVRMAGPLTWLGTDETRRLLGELCARFEGPGGYTPDLVDEPLMAEMLDEIVGFEIRVRDVRPKLKLSQNRTPEDWERVRDQFAAGPSPGPDLAAWMSRTRR